MDSQQQPGRLKLREECRELFNGIPGCMIFVWLTTCEQAACIEFSGLEGWKMRQNSGQRGRRQCLANFHSNGKQVQAVWKQCLIQWLFSSPWPQGTAG